MKNALIIILLFVFAYPCFAELTENDVRLIRQIIREEIEPVKIEMATMKGDIRALEGKMATKDDIIAMRDILGGQMNTLYGVLIGILVALIVGILGIFLVPFLKKWFEKPEPQRTLIISKEVNELKQRMAELEKRNIIT